MDEIEKAILAIMITGELLKIDKKILAIKIIRHIYRGANLTKGKRLVDAIQAFTASQ